MPAKKKSTASPSPIANLLSESALRRKAGPRYFQRGVDYFEHGNVRKLAVRMGVVGGTVIGKQGDYRTRFWEAKGRLEWECTCPLGDDGEFCKHLVATGLAFLDKENRKESIPHEKPFDLRAWLTAMSKEKLVGLLLEQAAKNDALFDELAMQGRLQTRGGVDEAFFRSTIDEAMDTDGFVPYGDMYDFCSRIDKIVDALEELLKQGHAVQAANLAAYMIDGGQDTYSKTDDSGGMLGDTFGRLIELFFRASQRGKADPAGVAKRLLEWELTDEYGICYDIVSTYLGKMDAQCSREYQRLAEAEWESFLARSSGGEQAVRRADGYAIRRIMTQLAQRERNLDKLIAVMSTDLSAQYHYLLIAEEYKKARRYGKALEWAEKGVAAFPDRIGEGMVRFLVVEYRRAKRPGEAMEAVWNFFLQNLNVQGYAFLHSFAGSGGDWPQWRAKALERIGEDIERANKKGGRSYYDSRCDRSRMVGILLWENDLDGAWEQARAGGCSDELWMDLAKRSETKRPADAAGVYLKRVPRIVERTNNEAYREAVGILKTTRSLMEQLGRSTEFQAYTAELRKTYKPKRNFIKAMDEATL